MSADRSVGRKQFLQAAFIGSLSLTVVSCIKDPNKTTEAVENFSRWLDATADALAEKHRQLQATQAALTTRQVPNTFTPSPSEEIGTRSISVSDQENLQKIRSVEGGEKIELEKALISYVIKIPRPGTDAVYGVYAIESDGKQKGVGIIENFDCGFEMLEDKNLLGRPVGSDTSPAISGLWKPSVHFEKIGGEIFLEWSAGTIPVITGTSYQLDKNQQTQTCPKDSIFSDAGEWPKNLARATGEIIGSILEGLQEGYFDN